MTDAIDLQFAAQEAEEIRQMLRRAALDIATIGQKLAAVKARLKHGDWGPWLRREFAWDERTAQRFMLVGQRFKNDNLSDLNITPSTLYLLAAPSTPKNVAQVILDKARGGKKIKHKDAIAAIKQHAPKGELNGDRKPQSHDVTVIEPPKPKPKPQAVDSAATTPEAVTVTSNASVEERRNLFLNLGTQMADDDIQWLREACEMFMATAKPDKLRKADREINKGVEYGHLAINCLRRLPTYSNPEWRTTAFDIVARWMKQNK